MFLLLNFIAESLMAREKLKEENDFSLSKQKIHKALSSEPAEQLS